MIRELSCEFKFPVLFHSSSYLLIELDATWFRHLSRLAHHFLLYPCGYKTKGKTHDFFYIFFFPPFYLSCFLICVSVALLFFFPVIEMKHLV